MFTLRESASRICLGSPKVDRVSGLLTSAARPGPPPPGTEPSAASGPVDARSASDDEDIVAVALAWTGMAEFGDRRIVDPPAVSRGPAEVLTPELLREVFALEAEVIPEPTCGTPLVLPLRRPPGSAE